MPNLHSFMDKGTIGSLSELYFIIFVCRKYKLLDEFSKHVSTISLTSYDIELCFSFCSFSLNLFKAFIVQETLNCSHFELLTPILFPLFFLHILLMYASISWVCD